MMMMPYEKTMSVKGLRYNSQIKMKAYVVHEQSDTSGHVIQTEREFIVAFSLERVSRGLHASHDTQHDDFTEENNKHAETDITISVLDELK